MVDDAPVERWWLWLVLARRRLTGLRPPPRALLRAAAPVLADVRRTRPGVVLRVKASEGRSRGAVTGMLWEPDGSGTGIHVWPRDSFADQVASLAEQVQEVVQELSPAYGWSSAWPSCAEHPDTHPAELDRYEGVAVWQCPRAPGVRVPVGDLSAGR